MNSVHTSDDWEFVGVTPAAPGWSVGEGGLIETLGGTSKTDLTPVVAWQIYRQREKGWCVAVPIFAVPGGVIGGLNPPGVCTGSSSRPTARSATTTPTVKSSAADWG